MAEIVDNSVWSDGTGRTTLRYPWDEWLDGKTRILTRGEDFDSSVAAVRNSIYIKGYRRNVKVRIRIIDENTVQIQAFR